MVADGERGSETYMRGNPTLFGAAKAAEQNWARPTVHDDHPRHAERTKRRNGGGCRNLNDDVAAAELPWPRPDASAANDGENVASWEARRQRVIETGINGNGMGTPLGIAVRQEEATAWPRLTVTDGSGGGSWSEEKRRANPATSAGGHSQKEMLGARLNPAWEETLLGFPIGLVSGLDWTEYGRQVAEQKREARRSTNGSPPDSPPE